MSMQVEQGFVATGLSRRRFLVTAAGGLGGLWLGFHLPGAGHSGAAHAASSGQQINAFIAITPDNRVQVVFGGCEFGQATMTGFAQIVAEELHALWSQVDVQQSDASINPATGSGISYPIFFSGSTPVNILYTTGASGALRIGNPNRFTVLRLAGAAAREMLITAGANKMGVARAGCSAIDGAVTAGNQSITFGALAAAAALVPVPSNPPLTDPSQFRYIGQAMPRLDIPQKTDGSAKYGIDIRLDGMLYAVVKHCPTIGGTLAKTPSLPRGARYIFPLKVETTRGAVIKGGVNAVAVVAGNTWQALQAARSLRPSWTMPSSAVLSMVDSASIDSQAHTLMNTGTPLFGENNVGGDPDLFLSSVSTKIDSTYSFPYVPHVSMEVVNCTVKYTGAACEIWAPTQSAASCAVTAKGLTGLTGSNIIVHTTFLGGGLGRKIEQDYISQAIQTAMQLYQKTGSGIVKLMWPREEDFSNDQYRPMALVRVRAGLDSYGNVALAYRTVTPGISWRAVDPSQPYPPAGTAAADSNAIDGVAKSRYGFVARRVEHVPIPAMIPVGFWRSVGCSINPFALECALDELARVAKKDPLELRQNLLAGDSRALAVVNAAANLSPWRNSLPSGHAWGMAYAEAFGSLVCQVVDISLSSRGSLRVNRVACAVDCGTAVNPGSIEAQMQGGIAHGLSAAMWGQQKFVAGQPQIKNFNAFRMLRATEMPQVAVTILNSGYPVGGIGEVGVPPIGPAVANAYFRLTGNRFYSMPFYSNAGGYGGG